MSLEDRVMAMLKQAMRDKNNAALRTLRAIKAALLEEKTAVKAKDMLTEADESKLIQKMAKQRKDAMTIFEEQNRSDLAEKEREELEILQQFLPEQLSDEELTSRIKELIGRTGAVSQADMGKVMGLASKELAGQAEGAVVAAKVRALLS